MSAVEGQVTTLAGMYEYAEAAVEGALAAGATYADARVVVTKQEGIDVQNQAVQSVDRIGTAGVGVRALIGSSWGFFATADLTRRAATAAGERAAEIARASAVVPGDPMELADVDVVQATYETPYVEDPFAVPLSEKVDLLVGVTETMQEVDGIALATGNLDVLGHQQVVRLVAGPPDPSAPRRVRRRLRRHRPRRTGDPAPFLSTVVRPVRDRWLRDGSQVGLRGQCRPDRRRGGRAAHGARDGRG